MIGAGGTGTTIEVSWPLMLKVYVVRLWALMTIGKATRAREAAAENIVAMRLIDWILEILANGMKAQEWNERRKKE